MTPSGSWRMSYETKQFSSALHIITKATCHLLLFVLFYNTCSTWSRLFLCGRKKRVRQQFEYVIHLESCFMA